MQIAFALYAVVSYGFLKSAYEAGSYMHVPYFSQFLHTHPYFPVTTWLWDGKEYTSTPCEAHRQIFDMHTRRHVIAQHPHGPVAIGAGMTLPQLSRWGSDFLSPLRVGTASAVMNAPFIRDLYALFGAIDASRPVLDAAMHAGKSIMLLPGGIREQLMSGNSLYEPVLLRSRLGFIKLALRHGAKLTPSLVFGERRLYNHSPMLQVVAKLIKKAFNMGIPAIGGRWGTLVPFARPIDIVLGRPIDTVKWLAQHRREKLAAAGGHGGDSTSAARKRGSVAEPPGAAEADKAEVDFTLEEAEALSEYYIHHLTDMFEELKDRFDYGDVTLQVR